MNSKTTIQPMNTSTSTYISYPTSEPKTASGLYDYESVPVNYLHR